MSEQQEQGPIPPDWMGRLRNVRDAMATFATTAPSPQQTRTKSAREMVGYFASMLTIVLLDMPPAAPPERVSEGKEQLMDAFTSDADELLSDGTARPAVEPREEQTHE